MTTPTSTRSILLIEDDPHDRALVKRLLQAQRRQYVIHEATTGEAGLAKCRELRPDCILLDYYLPDMDGREWLSEYSRENGRRPAMPVALRSVTHNLGVVEYIADEVAVMRAGHIVEAGPSVHVLGAPQHEYTRALLAAVPGIGKGR